MMAAFLREFYAACDAAAATASKLKKQEVLANYFRSLDEADLRRSVRYARGRAFSSTDENSMLHSPQASGPLSLNEMANAFDDMGATGVMQRKREILRRLFTRCIY